MQIHTLSEHLLVKPNILVDLTVASNNGAIVDTKGYTKAMAIFYTDPTGTAGTSDCKLQMDTVSNMASPTDVPSADFATITEGVDAPALQLMEIDLENSNIERYIRLVHTGAVAANGPVAGIIVLFRGRRLSPAQDNTVVSV